MRTAAAALLALCVACGGDDPKPRFVPRSVDLAIVEQKATFVRGDAVSLVAQVRDGEGKKHEGTSVVFAATPETSANAITTAGLEATFKLAAPGPVIFTACVRGAPSVCGTASVVVDDGSPRLLVDAPAPGAELDGDTIAVSGSVTDTGGTPSVFVNGQPAEVGVDGSFHLTLPARFGIEHVEVVASDGRTVPTVVERDVLVAAAYGTARRDDGAPGFQLPGAIGIRFGQVFFDDGLPPDLGASPLVIRDLADVLAYQIASLPLEGALPDPVVDARPALFLRVPDASLGTPHVEVTLLDGGLEVYMQSRVSSR